MSRPVVLGAVVDSLTRCVHYRTELDIVAIRFPCCDAFYPCRWCHDEVPGQHPTRTWPAADRDEAAVLCGACRRTLRIDEYTAAESCPHCTAPFNPRCKLHEELYFEPLPAP
ncbi:CHY zinc finger protein [Zafaria sp. Z1313]|uniref:CHY zinc finger protein n=1 Tax=unclassified Zafaria TaxID=2828765 RepID=UPI002E780D11|nr:CHY zinc finger protein [Zafaria sp. J156]MEE1620872.1 CHY zinc finger protein [Zafaria sp. J156]